jgi:NAD(P)-dependent dehydrogenase (short-subunit alcohol dehydrogenase family)
VAVKSDLSNLEGLDRLYKEVAQKKGKIDILFANAGIVETIDTPASTPEHFDKTFNINAGDVYFTVQKAFPLLNDGASIILTGSVPQKEMPIYSTYAATKAALGSHTRTWTAEFGKRGIRANVISHGPIETPILDRQFTTKEAADALRAQFEASIPLGRIGLRDAGTAGALFLASSESSYISGIDLPVDGGMVSV